MTYCSISRSSGIEAGRWGWLKIVGIMAVFCIAVQQCWAAPLQNPSFPSGTGWTCYGTSCPAVYGANYESCVTPGGTTVAKLEPDFTVGSIQGIYQSAGYADYGIGIGDTFEARIRWLNRSGSNPNYDSETRVGIDPNGGTNPASATWCSYTTSSCSWSEISVETTRPSGPSNFTVFIECRCKTSTSWANCMVDWVSVERVEPTGTVHGHARFEKVKGNPGLGYQELYEYKAFLCRDGATSDNYGFHCGDPGSAWDPYSGCFVFPDVPAGTYSLMSAMGIFFPRGKVTSSITVTQGITNTYHSNEPIDYSGYYTKSDWDPSGGNPVFQTFVATGGSISRVSFAKADGNSDGVVQFSIHQDNGGNVETWPQVGTTKSVNRGGSGGDHWVAWQAGEVSTVPGTTYAVRLYGTSGVNIQPYWSNDSYYPNGTGYRWNQSNPAGHDYYIVVFSDNDDTIATMQVTTSDETQLTDWKNAWAQGYTARGTSFAGAVLNSAPGGGGAQLTGTCSVHHLTPNGTQVGPSKTIGSVGHQASVVYLGACFSQGEVPTTVGQAYWVVFDIVGGFNPRRMGQGNVYNGGTAAYLDGSWTNTSYDLLMNLFEYASTEPVPTPTITPTPVSGANLLNNWSFELSSGTTHPSWTNNSNWGTNGTFPDPSPPQDGTQWASYSYGGGDSSQQDLYQTVSVTPGHTYYLTAWCYVGGNNGDATARLLWNNGGYPGIGSGTELDALTWTNPDPFPGWVMLSGFATPTTPNLTFILRADINGWGGGVNFDACSVVDQSVSDTPTPTNTPTNTPTHTPTNTPTNTRTNTPTNTPASAWTPQTGIDSAGWRIYR